MVRLDIDGLQVNIDYKDIEANQAFILPTLELRIAISTKVQPGREAQAVIVTNMLMEVTLTNRARDFQQIVGYAKPVHLQEPWGLNTDTTREFNLTLDHYVISQIEKVRAGGNLYLRGNIRFQAQRVNDPASIKEYHVAIDEIEVPKSHWVEETLPNLGYKNVSLIEIPQLSDKNFSEVIKHLNDAWKQYSMGEPDKVLTACRKALEELGARVRNAGFEKEDENQKGEKVKVPDWKKFFANDDIGDITGTINKKIRGFVAPGAHAGKAIGRTDAALALMITHALAHYVTTKMLAGQDE